MARVPLGFVPLMIPSTLQSATVTKLEPFVMAIVPCVLETYAAGLMVQLRAAGSPQSPPGMPPREVPSNTTCDAPVRMIPPVLVHVTVLVTLTPVFGRNVAVYGPPAPYEMTPRLQPGS